MLKSPLIFPEGSFKAHLYDCDGTLADTMVAHVKAWVEECQSRGVNLDGQLIHDLAGMPATTVVGEINRRYHSNLNAEEIAQAKEDRFHQHYLDQVKPIPDVVENLKEAHKNGIRIGVVSGGRKRVVQETLKIIGVNQLVEVVICAEDVKHGKPHPEPFLMAAEHLKTKPEDCLVFEDADLGIESAERAGMKWVRIYT